jgi:hypothetical protein
MSTFYTNLPYGSGKTSGSIVTARHRSCSPSTAVSHPIFFMLVPLP